MTLRKEFGDLFARTAFGKVAGDEAIIGKWGNIVRMEDGSWDFWIVGPDGEPMGEQRITYVLKNLPPEASVQRLEGEAFGSFRGLGKLATVARALGVRRKRRMGEAQKAAGAERLRQARAARG